MASSSVKWLARAVLGLLALAVVLVFGGVVALKAMPPPTDQRFATSTACVDCHRDESTGWQDSSHAKMMRRADQPGAVIPDLHHVEGAPPFHPDEAVWVIGSKWAQQFMGEVDGDETLLPGEWHIGLGQWETTGWDGWELPKPLQRCHGCHTVGLNVETGEFAEAGIGCESCHGAHGFHVDTAALSPGTSLLDAQVCGRCHSRGRSTDGSHFFAHDYKPGDDLGALFVEDEPDFIQNSANWWGNGRERARHQEYTAWKRGGHADSLRSLTENYDGRFGPVSADCMQCHSAEGAVAGLAVDVERAKNPITCAACHNSHGKLDEVRATCESCHDQGPLHHSSVAAADHIPCPPGADVGCVDCHMPMTAKLGGEFRLHSHAPGITTPEEGAVFGSPSTCANGGCHANRTAEWLQDQFEQHYPNFPSATPAAAP